jgi:hypothetical protein
MLHDYVITKASKKRTAFQTALSYGIPHIALGTPFAIAAPLFLKTSSKKVAAEEAKETEEPAPLATKWYNPLLAGVGIMAPIGALTGYAFYGNASGAIMGSLGGAFSGLVAGLQGIVLDYLVTKFRGKRGPVQNLLVYSFPYIPAIMRTVGAIGATAPYYR